MNESKNSKNKNKNFLVHFFKKKNQGNNQNNYKQIYFILRILLNKR